VKDLVITAIEKWGSGNWKNVSDTNAPHEAGLLKLDITKAKQKLGWQPKLNAPQSIEWTLQWYQQQQNKKEEFTYKQIQQYLDL
jgi:CDP-glucose 4,6-dehydratase